MTSKSVKGKEVKPRTEQKTLASLMKEVALLNKEITNLKKKNMGYEKIILNNEIKKSKSKKKLLKSQFKDDDTPTIISPAVQQIINEFANRLKETMQTDEPSTGIEEILRSLDERKSKHEEFIDLSCINNTRHIEPPKK